MPSASKYFSDDELSAIVPKPQDATQPSRSSKYFSDEELSQLAPKPSTVEALGRGIVSGVYMGFDDELMGAAKSMGVSPSLLSALSVAGGPGAALAYIQGQVARKLASGDAVARPYRQEQGRLQAAKEAAQEARPGAYLGGQLGGGVAAAAIPGMAPASLAKMVGVGAASGAGSALGESKADLLKGEFGQAAADTAIGGAIGGAAGGVLGVAGKALGGIVSKFRQSSAAKSVAKEIAAGSAEESAGAGYRKTVAEQIKGGEELEKKVSGRIGEEFLLTPAQKTGNPAMALAEQKARQFPDTMAAAQKLKQRELDQATKYIDMTVDAVAADPKMLGNANVSKRIGETIELYVDTQQKVRTDAAGPLYRAAKESGAEIPVAPIRATLIDLIEANKFNPSQVPGRLKKVLALLPGDDTAAISIGDLQNLRSLMTKAAAGKATLIENQPIANQQRIAREVLKSIDVALDEEAQMGGAGAEWLQKANAVWREKTIEIENAATETVARMLKVSQTDKSSTLVHQLARLEPEQAAGVFSILNKQAPDVAQDTFAQLIENAMVDAGKSVRGQSIAGDIAGTELVANQAWKQLKGLEPIVKAGFGNDAKRMMEFRDMMSLMNRMRFSPKIEGSPTASYLAQEAKDKAFDTVAAGAGPAGQAVFGTIKSFLGSDKMKARVLSDPEGIRAINDALRVYLSKKPNAKLSTAATLVLTRLGLEVGGFGESR